MSAHLSSLLTIEYYDYTIFEFISKLKCTLPSLTTLTITWTPNILTFTNQIPINYIVTPKVTQIEIAIYDNLFELQSLKKILHSFTQITQSNRSINN